jgi:proteasome lid subunit RPN8/RPN11
MLSHVVGGIPEEVCGLLGGQLGQADVIYTITNSEHSPTRFRMDSEEQLAAMLEIDAKGLEIVAFYHSHPNGPCFPSKTDLEEFAYPGVTMLIWSPLESGTTGAIKNGVLEGWRVDGFSIEDGQFSTIELQFETRVDNAVGGRSQ